MREQIRILVNPKDLQGAMTANKRMANLQKTGYNLVDFKIMDDGIQDYYLEKESA